MNELFSMRMLSMNDDIPEPPLSDELNSIRHPRIMQWLTSDSIPMTLPPPLPVETAPQSKNWHPSISASLKRFNERLFSHGVSFVVL